jgi:hypothetical protein
MSHGAKLELLVKMVAHPARSSGLHRLPLIMCAMAQMRDAVRDSGLAKRAEESRGTLMAIAPSPAKGLLRSMAWIARGVTIQSARLAELAVPRLCARHSPFATDCPRPETSGTDGTGAGARAGCERRQLRI